MSAWDIAGTVLVGAVGLSLWGALRGGAMDRLIAAQLASTLTVLALLVFAQGFARPMLLDLAVLLAVLSLPTVLVFAQWVRRWA